MITWIGNTDLLRRRKTGFLCSQRTPHSLMPLIQRWAARLDADDCVVCGNESEIEQVVFSTTLARRIPIILLLAYTPPQSWPAPIAHAIDEERLLVGSHCTDLHITTRDSAKERNRLIIELSDHIVVGYCTKDGDIDRATRAKSNITFITHPHDLRQ